MPSQASQDNKLDKNQCALSQVMNITKRGRPFLKDILDVFAALFTLLQLQPHKLFFRTYINTFSTEEAIQILTSLKPSSIGRPDPKDTTTTSKSTLNSRKTAKALGQYFLDMRLIENAVDQSNSVFEGRSLFTITPKGLHIMELFISKNNISVDGLQHVFVSQPTCNKLMHLERRSIDDEIIISESVINALFRHFVGHQPNYPSSTNTHLDKFQQYNEWAKGVGLQDITEKVRSPSGRGEQVHEYCFTAIAALNWLCDFTSVVGREEAAEMSAQFARFGLITLVSDKRKSSDFAILFTVRGSTSDSNPAIKVFGEFRWSPKAIYKITDEGRQLALWNSGIGDAHGSASTSSANLVPSRPSAEVSSSEPSDDIVIEPQKPEVKTLRLDSLTTQLNANYEAGHPKGEGSDTSRLRYILEEPALRSLFREFLRDSSCEENLSFWMDVQDVKRKFSLTLNLVDAASISGSHSKQHESLVTMVSVIYNDYLAPSSLSELNISRDPLNELAEYLEDEVLNLTGQAFQGRLLVEQAMRFTAHHIQTLIRFYEHIQNYVFYYMAFDSLPKFIKTPEFLALPRWLQDFSLADQDPGQLSSERLTIPGLEGSVGAYITADSARDRGKRLERLRETNGANGQTLVNSKIRKLPKDEERLSATQEEGEGRPNSSSKIDTHELSVPHIVGDSSDPSNSSQTAIYSHPRKISVVPNMTAQSRTIDDFDHVTLTEPLLISETSYKSDSLVSRLKLVFGDVAQYKQLLGCREARAQKILDLFHELLDTVELDVDFKRSLIVATQRLSKASGLFPTCYSLEGVQYAGDPVAAGSFADIYKGSFRDRSVCVKVIRVYQTSRLEHFLKKCAKEALLWGQLAHPNVCPIYGLYRHDTRICLVSPWMDNGNLHDYLERYPLADRLLLVCDAAEGLMYLHDNEIIHGDLKGANILVSASGRARLADFGLSSVSDANILAWTSNSSAESKGGSVRWQAPELFNFESDEVVPNSKASDVYALSSVCYEAFTGAVPYAHLNYDASVIVQVKAGNTPPRPPDSSESWRSWGLTEIIWSIMTDCWNADPSLRPTVHQVAEILTRGVSKDQRSADDVKTLSSAQFRKEIGSPQEIISVDALEKLIGIGYIPHPHSDREN